MEQPHPRAGPCCPPGCTRSILLELVSAQPGRAERSSPRTDVETRFLGAQGPAQGHGRTAELRAKPDHGGHRGTCKPPKFTRAAIYMS